MKNNIIYISLAALTLAGCAKEKASSPNADNKAWFDSWLAVNYPQAEKYGNGIWILPEAEKPGTGAEWDSDKTYSFLTYTIRSLDGTVSSNSDADIARQIGTYDAADYYGPQVIITGSGLSYAGIDETLSGMKAGGSRTAIIPSWLMTYSRYDTEADYLGHETSVSPAIYTITFHGQTGDIKQYKTDELFAYAGREWALSDTTTTGIFFKTHTPGKNETVAADTTVYINYTGRLLNGQVFDTTIEKVAKDNNIYVAGKTYAPLPVTWAEEAADIQLDGSTVVTGFAEGLYQMHQGESASFAFTYDKGYGASSSSTRIPGYASLVYDVELVPAP